ncbi:MAG TPA: class I SAM-dependent methyltransferase [Flavobacteriales bacterium]|jgi:2-polyprenyl-3-methyl-5-hydroxy-6-metoxy-1,4-benzoquinol methylase|nr:class I SAM-dependent methyltransferase [Flavobacteriales bacterium]HIB77938.1 class I SAM-dependent methyltransferase [Flavobacteriales bacterium]HIN41645.1 class I SAM-dependent methyltransferase [Flavobacteriales bacterium]HIO58602.1 class I SAM-dependent methyltransferase [Flavobacteriales bacterium]
MGDNGSKTHWDNVYNTKGDNEVGWYQDTPVTSLQLIEELRLGLNDSVIDVGGGNSNLIFELTGLGFSNLTVLDISSSALNRTKKKMGSLASRVTWVVSDILDYESYNEYELIHDRAAFHFLTNPDDVERYAKWAMDSTKMGGYIIISTFSLSGPKRCSNLDIVQYSAKSLEKVFRKGFKLVKTMDTVHITPFNSTQNFVFCVFKRV